MSGNICTVQLLKHWSFSVSEGGGGGVQGHTRSGALVLSHLVFGNILPNRQEIHHLELA